MKNQSFEPLLFEFRLGALDCRCRVAKHGRHYKRLVVSGLRLVLYHSANDSSRPGIDFTTNAINASHINDAGNHDNIFDSHITGNVTTGDGADHYLRDTEWQFPHCSA